MNPQEHLAINVSSKHFESKVFTNAMAINCKIGENFPP